MNPHPVLSLKKVERRWHKTDLLYRFHCIKRPKTTSNHRLLFQMERQDADASKQRGKETNDYQRHTSGGWSHQQSACTISKWKRRRRHTYYKDGRLHTEDRQQNRNRNEFGSGHRYEHRDSSNLYERSFGYNSRDARGVERSVLQQGRHDQEHGPHTYGSVSLLSVINKCHTFILNKRLYAWLEENN